MDLSSASDLLSLELVKAVFSNRPRFLSGILGCRTPSIKIGNRTVSLKKYAGMGNATTFPVQSVVFAVVALTAMSRDDEVVTKRSLSSYARLLRIYGDDIIVHSKYYPCVSDWISSCGLKINRSKTFSEGNFRESCGVDAYDGVNVTPVYLRQDPDLASTDPNALASIVSTSNQLWLAGRYSLAESLLSGIKGKLPLTHKDSGVIGLHNRWNACTVSKWNRSLHRFEYRAPSLQPVKMKDVLDGYAALFKFFHSPRIADYDPTHLEVSVRRFQSKLKYKWFPSLGSIQSDEAVAA